jgi:hypothetical protein
MEKACSAVEDFYDFLEACSNQVQDLPWAKCLRVQQSIFCTPQEQASGREIPRVCESIST